MKQFTRNLSRITQPCVRVAAMVVSDMNDRLSPKKAPPATMAVTIGRLVSVLAAIPTATGTRATMVPTEVPIDSDMKHDARKIPAKSRLSGSSCRVRFTVASMAPIVLAVCANAPARMNIHIISMIFLLAAPIENCRMRSLRLSPLVVAMAYAEAVMNATVMGTL